MGDLPNDVDIHTKESRIALTKMIMRLFDFWQISLADQAILLNHSPSTIRRYKNGECFADNKDMHDRVGNLLIIHKRSGHISKPGQPYGDEAFSALRGKLQRQRVRLDIMDVDRYKRSVGIVWLGSRNINKEMVLEG